MKTVGRIILLVVGVLLLVNSIPNIIQNWKALNAVGWEDITSYPDKMTCLSAIVMQGVNAFFGITALFGCITGRLGLWLTISSLIMIGTVIWFFVNAYKEGTIGDFQNIMQTLLGFILPIGYFVGSIFLIFK